MKWVAFLAWWNHSKQGSPSDTYKNNKFLSLSLFLPFRVGIFLPGNKYLAYPKPSVSLEGPHNTTILIALYTWQKMVSNGVDAQILQHLEGLNDEPDSPEPEVVGWVPFFGPSIYILLGNFLCFHWLEVEVPNVHLEPPIVFSGQTWIRCAGHLWSFFYFIF